MAQHLVAKNLLANAGDASLTLGLGRCPGRGNDNPLQYSCLGNAMDRGAWQATAHGVAKSDTNEQLSTHTHMKRNLGGRKQEHVYILEYHNLIILPAG